MQKFYWLSDLKAAAIDNVVTVDLTYPAQIAFDTNYETLRRYMSEALIGSDLLAKHISFTMSDSNDPHSKSVVLEVSANISDLLNLAEADGDAEF